jgi:hypothetical protein
MAIEHTMTSISSKNTPTMALKIDDRIPAPDRAVGLVQALVRQAQARGLCVQQHATREWGLADLETDICVHVLHGATLYHPKPWNLNVAVIPEDVAELPPNLPRYDVLCRVSGSTVAMESPQGLIEPGQAALADLPAFLVDALTDALDELPVARRLESARERVRALNDEGPLVSVLLPTHDRVEFLGHAVDSVLAQTYANWELLVIQDGGPDVSGVLEAPEPRRDPRIRLLRTESNMGKPAALNMALAHVQGAYVAYLDDDDIWLPEHLEALMRMLVLAPGVRMAHSEGDRLERRRTDNGWEVDQSTRTTPHSGHVSLYDILEDNSILGITVAHETALFSEAGRFDERLDTLVDFDMWRRLAAQTHPCHVRQVTAEFYVWAHDDPARSQMTGLFQRDPVRYLANRHCILSKRLPQPMPQRVSDRWAQVRRKACFDFLLQRGITFVQHKRPGRALRSLRLARRFCPQATVARRSLAVVFLQAGDAKSCLALLQHCLMDGQGRLPADFLYAALAQLQLGRPHPALALLERLETEFELSAQERELADRYAAMAREVSKGE